MSKILILAGAPGSGKTTVKNLLRERLTHSAFIDLGHLRQFHLDKTWSNASGEEEEMSFENLISIVQNYIKHTYDYVVVLDLHNDMIKRIDETFPNITTVVSLIIQSDDELKKRVLDETRDSGFRNVDEALFWNKELKTVSLSEHETKMDNTHNTPSQTVEKICELIEK